MRTVILMLVGALVAGCASSPVEVSNARSIEIEIEPGGYADAFARAKEALRETGFTIGRVDARAGIISTEPRASVGYLTPWVGHHEGAREAWLGFANREQRVGTVIFEPADGSAQSDLRTYEHAITARVEVTVERVEHPGRRVDASGVDFAHRSPGSAHGIGIHTAPTPNSVRLDEALILKIRQIIY